MNRRFVAGFVAVALVAACTNSKAAPPAPPTTTRAPLRPVGTTTSVADLLNEPSSDVVAPPGGLPFGGGCSDTSIPFQVTGEVPGWSTIGSWRSTKLCSA